MVENQLIAVHISLLCSFLSRRVGVIKYLESHVVNFVMLLDLFYESSLLQKEIPVMMLLSEGRFDTFMSVW